MSAVVGRCNYKWMDTEYVLSQFGNKRKKAIESYRQFIKEGLNMGRIPELTGGGLIRSLGGWSQVISMRRKDIEVESDERILGGSDFVAGILKDAEERQIRQLKLPKSDKSIDKIIEEECRKRHIRPIELKGCRNCQAFRGWYICHNTGYCKSGKARNWISYSP